MIAKLLNRAMLPTQAKLVRIMVQRVSPQTLRAILVATIARAAADMSNT
jgi:hypothetical protein